MFGCDGCRLEFAAREPDSGELPRLYGERYFTSAGSGYRSYLGEEASHRFQARRYLRRLESLVRPGALLDIGCAAGFFLDEARRSGWSVRGLDVSPWASVHARQALGMDVATGSFLESDWGAERFDAVTMFNVLEHMASPRAVETRLAGLIRPGGIVAVETWDSTSLVARVFGHRWQQYDPRLVPYYYSPTALERLFPAPRWIPRIMARAAKWISVRRGLEIVADRSGFARGLFDRLATSAIGRPRIPYLTGELLFAVFERAAAPATTDRKAGS